MISIEKSTTSLASNLIPKMASWDGVTQMPNQLQGKSIERFGNNRDDDVTKVGYSRRFKYTLSLFSSPVLLLSSTIKLDHV